MQHAEEIARPREREWLGIGATVERFERSLAGVAVTVRKAAKFRFAQFRGTHDRAINDRASHLESARITLRESSAGKINRRDRKPVSIERAQIIREQPDFFELRWRRANRFTHVRKGREFGSGSAHVSRVGFDLSSKRSSRRLDAFASTRDGCATQTWEFELILIAQRPRFDAAVAQIARKLGRK